MEDKADLVASEESSLRLSELVDVGAVDRNDATVGVVDSADEVEERSFAAATRAKQCNNLGILDIQCETVEQLLALIRLQVTF